MTEGVEREVHDSRIYEHTTWVRATLGNGGFFFPIAELGDFVHTGDVLGKVVDPLTDASFDVISPRSGEVIGMSVSRPVLPGYALYHLAWHDSE